MTLELNQVAPQVKAMGHSLSEQYFQRNETLQRAKDLLQQFSKQHSDLHERIQRAEKIQEKLLFGWVGAAPTNETLNKAYHLPQCPEEITIIASDGSQILPDQHAVALYYLINIGSIIYRHGSNQKPETYNPPPVLRYEPDILDQQGRPISSAEVSVKRDLAELKILIDRVNYLGLDSEPIITLLDGRLSLRVIDLPSDQQKKQYLMQYVDLLNELRQLNALLAGYIDRPRSTFVLSLLHLAGLDIEAINEDNLKSNSFRTLTDTQLFDFLEPGERSAIFSIRAKELDAYERSGHGLHFFYVNVGENTSNSILARVEIPKWLVEDKQGLDLVHAAIVRQARIAGNYPYVLTRAHELAVVSAEERESFEMMLTVEMIKNDLLPEVSRKQRIKILLSGKKEGYRRKS